MYPTVKTNSAATGSVLHRKEIKFTLGRADTHTQLLCEIISLQTEVVCVLRGSWCDLVACVMG